MGRVGSPARGHARRTGTVAVAAAAAALCLTVPAEARPATADDPSYSATTSVGVHNAYEKAKYPYFADALDSGASLLELDVWTNAFGAGWRVSHSNPLGNDNNCENAAGPGELRTKPRDQSLAGCLADMRAWHQAHPGHRPVLVKVEMKDGFNGKKGRGPADLDALLGATLGDAVLRPADVVGGRATLDEAVQAGGWPSRSALAGKFIVELIPGTVEENNPWTRCGPTVSTPPICGTCPPPGGSVRPPPSPPSTAPPPATRAPATPTPPSGRGSCSSTGTRPHMSPAVSTPPGTTTATTC
ncbi:hypothetical protein SVIO_095330 [Streptomyces violaceusniger]|uniref:Uncharacterized protein n=1 Tax=Streptomyces violaceusniger TaxID=68280 RepID=A0A4D4LIA2_STRVO|nr:hypothetical protein SVIO_095330 [Streptomyces violaceusniger]